MKYCSLIIRAPGYPHSECFVEVARAMDDALKALDAYDPDGTPIVFGGHLEKRLPEGAIVYNAEQVFSWDYIQTLRKHRVWDYSQNNIESLAAKGIKAKLCPIAYMPSMTCIEPREQDIDVLMYGSRNERRMKIFNELKTTKIRAEYAFSVYGAGRDALIARSKIVLNVHFYPEVVHEIFRTSHLMTNRVCVVSEKGRGDVSGPAYYPYDYLVGGCWAILETKFYQELGERGFDEFSKTSMVDSLRGLI